MSNQCVIGFQIDDRIKAAYSHWGSSPSRLGKEISLFLSKLTKQQIKILNDHTKQAVWVSLDHEPSQDQIKKYKQFSDTSVSSTKLTDWYCLLYKTQGIATLIYLLSGDLNHLVDSTHRLSDSMFCEWGYILNFDDQTLDIYEGDQTKPDPTNHLGQKSAHTYDGKSYYPCKRIKQVDLFDPLGDSEWLAMIEKI